MKDKTKERALVMVFYGVGVAQLFISFTSGLLIIGALTVAVFINYRYEKRLEKRRKAYVQTEEKA